MTTPSCQQARRVAVPAEPLHGPPVEKIDGVWHIRSLPLVREVLRTTDGLVQSGFNAEEGGLRRQRMRPPILFADGEAHRTQRAAIARFFTPRTVQQRYRDLMTTRADRLVEDLLAHGGGDFSAVTMRYSVEVAAQVIGLTESDTDAMAVRLERLFGRRVQRADVREPLHRRIRDRVLANWPIIDFHRSDVLPAIAVRRARHASGEAGAATDVISHLIEHDYTDLEILTECLTYGAAGMITTREFLQIALSHLLADADLRSDYLGADPDRRQQILSELLRLEPVVGHLFRRATTDIDLVHDQQRVSIAAGERLDLHIRSANLDPDALGGDAESICPARPTPSGVRAEAMSFGDGAHRCPGNAVALQESEILLTALLRRDVFCISGPEVSWDALTQGYELRRFLISVHDPDRLPAPIATMLARVG